MAHALPVIRYSTRCQRSGAGRRYGRGLPVSQQRIGAVPNLQQVEVDLVQRRRWVFLRQADDAIVKLAVPTALMLVSSVNASKARASSADWSMTALPRSGGT